MNQFVSEKIVNELIENGIIIPDDKELYRYGLQQGITIILNILITILIGLAFKMVWQSMIFMLAYIPLRSFAGGFHAKTQLRCHILSIALIIMALLGIRIIQWTNLLMLFVVFLASSIIILLAPMESNNKSLNQKERIVFKKYTRAILCLLVGIAMIIWFLGYTQFSISIIMAIIILSIMLLIGKTSYTYT